jgi:hypothetical protein
MYRHHFLFDEERLSVIPSTLPITTEYIRHSLRGRSVERSNYRYIYRSILS